MEGADVDSRFSEEANADLIAATILDREANSRRDRNVTADDPVSAEEVRVGIENVHGAALTTGAAGVAAKELGHDCPRTDPARESLSVVAISRDYVIIGADHRHHAGRDRFLSDVQVTEAADFSEGVRFSAALLEAALEEHRVKIGRAHV